MDENLWDDIDDDILVQMSQIAENDNEKRSKRRSSCRTSVLELTESEDWNIGEVEANRFHQLQTQLPLGNNDSAFKTPRTNEYRSHSGRSNENDEVYKLRAANAKLLEEIYAKRGEVSLLRDDLRKRSSTLERTAAENSKLNDIKKEAVERCALDYNKKIDSLITNEQFLKHQIDQLTAKLKSYEVNGSGSSHNRSFVTPVKTSKRSLEDFPESGQLSRQILDPFRQSPPTKKSKPLALKENVGVQTVNSTPKSIPKYFKKSKASSDPILQKFMLMSQLIGKDFLELFPIKVFTDLSNFQNICQEASKKAILDFKSGEDLIKILPKIQIILEISGVHKFECREVLTSLLQYFTTNEDRERNNRIVISISSFLNLLIERKLLSLPSFICLLQTLDKYLPYMTSSPVLVSIINFLSATGNDAELAYQYCKASKDSCFIYKLCQSITEIPTENYYEISKSFIKFLNVHLSVNYNLRWIGEPVGKEACGSCRMDTLKCVSFLTVKTIQEIEKKYEKSCVDAPCMGTHDVKRHKLLKDCIYILHQFWLTDADFISHLCDSPSPQRQYIWATKKLAKMAKVLGLTEEETLMLSKLNVQYDEHY